MDREPTVRWNIALAKLVAMKFITKTSIAPFTVFYTKSMLCECQIKMMNGFKHIKLFMNMKK